MVEDRQGHQLCAGEGRTPPLQPSSPWLMAKAFLLQGGERKEDTVEGAEALGTEGLSQGGGDREAAIDARCLCPRGIKAAH